MRFMHIEFYKAAEGLKVEILMSPSLRDEIARHPGWSAPDDVRVSFGRLHGPDYEVVEMHITDGVEDYQDEGDVLLDFQDDSDL